MSDVTLVKALSLFRSSLFRESLWVQELCKEVGDVYATTREDWGSHGHFSTFFGVIVVRSYVGRPPEFNDLYILHELWHRKTLKYQGPEVSWLDWSKAIISSEFDASITSECLVYFMIPGLRRRTFKHEIWVDRFLPGGGAKAIENPNFTPLMIKDMIRKERLRALNTPDHDDFLEHQIWNYGHQNMLWCRVWSEELGPVLGEEPPGTPAFRVVNKHMSQPNWIETHPEWLRGVSGFRVNGVLQATSKDAYRDSAIPFVEQAAGFAPIYAKSMKEFGNNVLSR